MQCCMLCRLTTGCHYVVTLPNVPMQLMEIQLCHDRCIQARLAVQQTTPNFVIEVAIRNIA